MAFQTDNHQAIVHDADTEHESVKRVAFIIYGYGLGNSPSLINMATMFVKNGFYVDFFICDSFLGNMLFGDSRISIYNYPDILKPSCSAGFFAKVKWAIYCQIKQCLRLLPWKFQIEIEEKIIFKSISCFVKSVRKIIDSQKYKCFIGVEPLGMMSAYHMSKPTNIPFAYYNMELHVNSDAVTTYDFIINAVENKFIKFASFSIAQDFERGRLIAEQNGIQEDSIISVPVCAEGEPFRYKTSYLRDMFGLSADTHIVIYAGFIADWAMCSEIAESALSWPKNWVLVFHTHGYNDESYIKKIRQYESSNVLFSLAPVPYEDLPAFLASADIGIALYKDLGANFTLIGSASGKLAHYLKSGLPVIVNSYPGVAKIIDQYNCGIAIDEPSQLQEAIIKIFANYQQMHSGAYLCYEENYCLSRYIDKVVSRIDQLYHTGRSLKL